MRRHRKSAYQPYKSKKIKLPIPVIVIISAAIIIFVTTIIVGNILKYRLTHTVVDTTPIETLDTSTTKAETEQIIEHDFALNDIKSGFADFKGLTEFESIASKVREIGSSYDSITFVATGSTGVISYASPSVEEHTGLAASSSLIPYYTLQVIGDVSDAINLRFSALIGYKNNGLEKIIASELVECGADEIILFFHEYDSLDNDSTNKIIEIAKEFKESLNVDIGIELNSNIYCDVHNISHLEKIFKICDFLAIDMTGFTIDQVNDTMSSMCEPKSKYLLRPVLSGIDSELVAEIDKILTDNLIIGREYVSAPANKTEVTNKK